LKSEAYAITLKIYASAHAMMKFSKTSNPLPFEDLATQRVEDLVRQLACDFRKWHSIEATGWKPELARDTLHGDL
jgi:hypothetical protein